MLSVTQKNKQKHQLYNFVPADQHPSGLGAKKHWFKQWTLRFSSKNWMVLSGHQGKKNALSKPCAASFPREHRPVAMERCWQKRKTHCLYPTRPICKLLRTPGTDLSPHQTNREEVLDQGMDRPTFITLSFHQSLHFEKLGFFRDGMGTPTLQMFPIPVKMMMFTVHICIAPSHPFFRQMISLSMERLSGGSSYPLIIQQVWIDLLSRKDAFSCCNNLQVDSQVQLMTKALSSYKDFQRRSTHRHFQKTALSNSGGQV